jgi:glutathione peroxidase-family protein
MIFVAVLVFCNAELTACNAVSGSKLHMTEESCYEDLAYGIKYHEDQGFRVLAYKCVNFGEKDV